MATAAPAPADFQAAVELTGAVLPPIAIGATIAGAVVVEKVIRQIIAREHGGDISSICAPNQKQKPHQDRDRRKGKRSGKFRGNHP